MAGIVDLINAVLGAKAPQQNVTTSGDAPIKELGKAVNISKPEQVLSVFQKEFQDPALVSALMGNADVETGGSFDHAQKQYGGGPGRGLFQMEGSMLKAYNGYMKKYGVEDSVETQAKFVKSILTSGNEYDIGAGNRKKVQLAISTGDPNVITEAFTNYVERPGVPHMDRRIKATQNWYNKISK